VDPTVVLARDAEIAGAVGRVLDLHGPDLRPDADLAAPAAWN
jgi:hypothetical protein